MRKAEAASNKDCPVKISVVAPPLYALTTQTLDKVIDKTSDEFFIDCIRMECYTVCEFFMSAQLCFRNIELFHPMGLILVAVLLVCYPNNYILCVKIRGFEEN